MPFEARALPTAIFLGEEAVAGPFCRHCGWPLSLHGPALECRATPNALLGPICDCHKVETVFEEFRLKGQRWTVARRKIVRRPSTV